MFEVGDVVFCPLRGSGVVEAIETRTMLNESKEYVIIQMKEPSIVMMVPTDKIENSGFREINKPAEADKVSDILAKKEVEMSYAVDVKTRTKKNQGKLATGSFVECSQVVRDLTCMNHIKALSNSERTMLMQARKLLLSELSLIKHISVKEAGDMVDELLEG